MDTVCHGLDSLFVYIDGILVASGDKAEHRPICTSCSSNFGNWPSHQRAKCQFSHSNTDFLGHHNTQNDAMLLPDKVKAISNFKQPVTVKGLQEFIGMVNFYCRFIPTMA